MLTTISFLTITSWIFSCFFPAIISLLAIILAVYLLCKHKKLQTLIASLVLHQVKEVGTEVTQKEINSECRTLVCV